MMLLKRGWQSLGLALRAILPSHMSGSGRTQAQTDKQHNQAGYDQPA